MLLLEELLDLLLPELDPVSEDDVMDLDLLGRLLVMACPFSPSSQAPFSTPCDDKRPIGVRKR